MTQQPTLRDSENTEKAQRKSIGGRFNKIEKSGGKRTERSSLPKLTRSSLSRVPGITAF